MVKDILEWVSENHWVTLALSSKKRLYILFLIVIPTTQCRISFKNLERLIGKLHSMHLAVPGVIGHFYAMQVALTHNRAAKNATANLSTWFHQDIKFWWSLCVKMTTCLTYLDELVHRDASDMGYIDTSGQGNGGGLD